MDSSQDSGGLSMNFKRPENLFKASAAYTTACFVIATIFFLIRVYTRALYFRQARLYDLFLVIAWGIYVAYTVICYVILRVCSGIEQENNMPIDTFKTILNYFDIELILYDCIMFFMKVAILLQYIEIFAYRSLNRKMFWLCCFMMFANFVLYFISVVLESSICRRGQRPWSEVSNDQFCPINIILLNVVVNTVNSVSNIAILILPQVTIWKLHLAKEKKLGISILFLVGLFTCAASLVHLVYTIIIYRGTDNVPYYLYLSALWTYPETSFGMVVACVPIMPKFFREIRERVRKSKFLSRMCFFCQGRRSPRTTTLKNSRSYMCTTDGAFSDDEPLTIAHDTTERSDSISLKPTKSEERGFETAQLPELQHAP